MAARLAPGSVTYSPWRVTCPYAKGQVLEWRACEGYILVRVVSTGNALQVATAMATGAKQLQADLRAARREVATRSGRCNQLEEGECEAATAAWQTASTWGPAHA